jgi:general secretion pathway protein D
VIGGLGNFGLESNTFVFQYLDRYVRARVQLMEDENRVTLMGTPLILCANSQEAEIFVGEEGRPLVRGWTLETVTSESSTISNLVPEVDRRDIGTTLRILPRINADRTVTLYLEQDSSNLIPEGTTIPQINAAGTIEQVPVDTVTTARIEGTIVCRDGLTVAVGGLIREELSQHLQKVPILGDIPLLGLLFQKRVEARSRKELVLLVTPYVMGTPSEGYRRTRERMRALSVHPFHGRGDQALGTFHEDEAPRNRNAPDWVRDYLDPISD